MDKGLKITDNQLTELVKSCDDINGGFVFHKHYWAGVFSLIPKRHLLNSQCVGVSNAFCYTVCDFCLKVGPFRWTKSWKISEKIIKNHAKKSFIEIINSRISMAVTSSGWLVIASSLSSDHVTECGGESPHTTQRITPSPEEPVLNVYSSTATPTALTSDVDSIDFPFTPLQVAIHLNWASKVGLLVVIVNLLILVVVELVSDSSVSVTCSTASSTSISPVECSGVLL